MIVENKPGAGTNIGQEYVAKSAPDGYTLLLGSPAVTINPSLYKNLPFDALRDLTGVSMFALSANLLAVNPSLPAKNVKELIALAQSKPGKLTFSSSGNGIEPAPDGRAVQPAGEGQYAARRLQGDGPLDDRSCSAARWT